jgi:hypothetical protein
MCRFQLYDISLRLVHLPSNQIVHGDLKAVRYCNGSNFIRVVYGMLCIAAWRAN